MNKYGQYCPMARAAEILGDRWTLLIVRDIICGAQHFNALERGLPGIPRAVLTGRLKRLREAGIIERQEASPGRKSSYRLTQAGWELYPVIETLTHWGAKWAFGEPEKSELQPVLLLWWMHERLDRAQLPAQRVVVEFDFLESRPERYWLVLKPEDASVCIQHPGFEIDVLVTAELSAFFQVWLGRMHFSDALREERIQLDAPPALIRQFPSWFTLSLAAPAVRAAMNES